MAAGAADVVVEGVQISLSPESGAPQMHLVGEVRMAQCGCGGEAHIVKHQAAFYRREHALRSNCLWRRAHEVSSLFEMLMQQEFTCHACPCRWLHNDGYTTPGSAGPAAGSARLAPQQHSCGVRQPNGAAADSFSSALQSCCNMLWMPVSNHTLLPC